MRSSLQIPQGLGICPSENKKATKLKNLSSKKVANSNLTKAEHFPNFEATGDFLIFNFRARN